MAYRNRDDRFRSQNQFIREENRTIGNSRDYPLTDADRARFASEDFTRDRASDPWGDTVTARENRSGEPYTARPRFADNRYQGDESYNPRGRSRDWRDTHVGRGPTGQNRFEAGGGYSEDVGGSAMQNAVRSNRGRGQTEYWEPYTDNARPFFTGAHSGQVYETDISFGGTGRAGDHLYDDHAHDPDYRRWRENQLRSHDRDYYAWRNAQARNYDASYGDWCRSREEKFTTEFNAWRTSQDTSSLDSRAQRGQAAQPEIATDRTGDRTGDKAGDKAGQASKHAKTMRNDHP